MNAYNAWETDAEAKRMLEAVGMPESMMGVSVSKVRSLAERFHASVYPL